jgi:aryl-alcohol dehydrogenase-like predicted oxidoreductase
MQPKLCPGTMTFGLQCDETQGHAILDAAAAGGIDFIDTADVYPMGGGRATAGRTEQIVGAWLKTPEGQLDEMAQDRRRVDAER